MFDPSLDEFDEDDFKDTETDAPIDETLTKEKRKAIIADRIAQLKEPKPYVMKNSKKRLAIVDTETDPFDYGLIVKPFTLGFYDGERYVDFWGDDCVKQFFDYLTTLDDEYIIYAHNGGKFDFYFFLDHLDPEQTPLIMGGRLVKITFGGQEFRDSYSIIPQALGSYQKEVVDYNLFKRETREQHKKLIMDYQKSDCVYTFDLIAGFHNMFGDKLTIASAALPMLNSFTGFERFNAGQDNLFRKFYFGGRNQCFETGIIKGDWKVYDRNSMYPAVMKDELHPVSNTYKLQHEFTDDTDFACIDAINMGCLPTRDIDDGLDFTTKRGTFYATGHEIRAGLDTGTLKILRVRHAWRFDRKASFSEFVDRFYNLRLDAKAKGDKVRDILYKFCLNSGYGKFALNPRKFKQWHFTVDEIPQPQYSEACKHGWQFHSQSGLVFIWYRADPRSGGYYNIATAASITGAARANLLRNLSLAVRPIYCDTDSIICNSFSGALNETALGGWKLEATGDCAAIGGKKLYAVFNHDEVIKKASKGVRLEAHEIMAVCNGEEITYKNPVPNFSLNGSAEFVTRRINRTGMI